MWFEGMEHHNWDVDYYYAWKRVYEHDVQRIRELDRESAYGDKYAFMYGKMMRMRPAFAAYVAGLAVMLMAISTHGFSILFFVFFCLCTLVLCGCIMRYAKQYDKLLAEKTAICDMLPTTEHYYQTYKAKYDARFGK